MPNIKYIIIIEYFLIFKRRSLNSIKLYIKYEKQSQAIDEDNWCVHAHVAIQYTNSEL